MRRAGRAAAEVLQLGRRSRLPPASPPTTLDAIVHEAYIDRGGYPEPAELPTASPSRCAPRSTRSSATASPTTAPLRDGDIVNLDVTIFLDGVHGDTNATFLVGEVDPRRTRLVDVTQECLDLGIAAVQPGAPVLRHRPGHRGARQRERLRRRAGLRRARHRRAVPHRPADPALLRAPPHDVIEQGMIFTIEPMITIGTGRHLLWDDGWTAVTADGSRTAQFEHTLLVTDDGAEVLTTLGDRTPAAEPIHEQV